ncbi:hypothetical protein QF043_005879 [Pseudomonas sp. W3I7]|uniref:hypothetical protein n=1 Tax=Pseudomonas sp. W3I7 TaxID=3042292 RepID=UPI002794073E|nr:hypothetical protein [Pseudomonas sp. W3I7]MDQ0707087.1 hypothetical protein [Pseudomonas sp. W3I7]
MRNPYPISISGLFPNPTAVFYVSHHVSRIIREQLERQIIETELFDKKYGDNYWLSLKDSSVPGLMDLNVTGPEVSKRNKAVSYSLKMPSQPINQDPSGYEKYLEYHERAVKEVFDALQIQVSKPIESIYNSIRDEVRKLPPEQLKNPD